MITGTLPCKTTAGYGPTARMLEPDERTRFVRRTALLNPTKLFPAPDTNVRDLLDRPRARQPHIGGEELHGFFTTDRVSTN